jgi:hypothetical protein
MLPSEIAKPKRQRRRRNVALACLVAVFAAVAGLIAAAKFFQPPPVEIAAGEPKTLEELNAWYPAVPDADNAALRFNTLVQSRRFIRRQRLQVAFNPVDPGAGSDLTAIAQERQTVDELQALLELPGSRFPLDLSQGIGGHFGHLRGLNAAIRFEASLAEASAAKGDAAGCLERLEDAWRIGNLVKYEPILISQISRFAIDSIAANATEVALSQLRFDDSQLARLSSAVSAARDGEALYRALAGERCQYLSALEQSSLVVQVGMQFNVSQLTELMAATRLPLRERAMKMQSLNDEVASTRKNLFNPRRYVYAMGLAMLPNVSRADQSHMNSLVTNDLVTTAIAVERYAVAHGSRPRSLELLVPAFLASVPIDPYSGEPVLYRITPEEYVISSVGVNGVDDGGKASGRWQDIEFVVFLDSAPGANDETVEDGLESIQIR